MKINGETHYLWRAVDHQGEGLEPFVAKRRDRRAALKFQNGLYKSDHEVSLLEYELSH